MSADLFEAFVGSQGVKTESNSRDKETPSGLLVQSDDFFQSEDTWQPWPATASAEHQRHEYQSQALWETDQHGNDVLFDAGQIDTHFDSLNIDDEFGDFQEVPIKESDKHVSQVEPPPATVDLLDLEHTTPRSGDLTGITNSHLSRSSTSNEHAKTSDASASGIVAQEQVAIPLADLDDEWGDFETTETSGVHVDRSCKNEVPPVASQISHAQSQPGLTRVKQKERASSDAGSKPSKDDPVEEDPWDDFDTIGTSSRPKENHEATQALTLNSSSSVLNKEQKSRPINVPPPAVLLAWLPKIFSKLASQSRQPDADPFCGTATLQVYRVSARVIAGRAARWKRDTILAQSMRIGAAGRSGGMKLTTLDKGESRKEDQAAEDVIASWTRCSHMLNAAIARAKVQKPPMALSMKLAARTDTGLDVVTATHVCAVCGLRRNERVIGIDVNVSDTFGEFWVEHWGHRDCSDTWYAFNELLDQR